MPAALKLDIQFGLAQLRESRRMLAGVKSGYARAKVTAINKLLPKAKTQIVRVVSDELNLTQTEIRDLIDIHHASVGSPEGSITVKRQPVKLIRYGSAQAQGVTSSGRSIKVTRITTARQTPAGVKVKVRRSEGARIVKHAFIATMPSGHIGIFLRKPGAVHKAIMKNGKIVREALPIKEQYGPTVVGVIIGKPGFLKALSDWLSDQADTVMASQTDWLLEKGQPRSA